MSRDYYLISDLHIGGDAALDSCDFETELIEFLGELERRGPETELIIIGDFFGFWEITGVEGTDKLTTIIAKHGDLFRQLKRTGRKITITVIPGNHDYLLACDPSFIKLLGEYNVVLDPAEHIIRELDGKKIWIEHGSQHDGFNRAAEFGDPYVTPIGYYVTNHITSTAGRHSDYGRGEWLKDLESVQPYNHIPDWFLSNYFYREMSPLLRWTLLPFLFFFTISLVSFAGMILEQKAVLGTHIFNLELLAHLGIFGKLFGIVLMVDAVIVIFLLLLSIPFWFIYRDIRKMLYRYGLKAKARVNIQKSDAYLKAAREIFARDPAVAVYAFGHTHTPFLQRLNGKIVLNTGTWLKRLTRIKTWGRLLPDVFYPSFRLNYFRIYRREGKMVIDYERIQREIPSGLTLLQRLLILGRKRRVDFDIPARTVVEFKVKLF